MEKLSGVMGKTPRSISTIRGYFFILRQIKALVYVMIIIIFVLLFRQSHHVFRLLLIGCTSRIILTCRVRIFPYIDKCTVKLLVHLYHYFNMYIRISGS